MAPISYRGGNFSGSVLLTDVHIQAIISDIISYSPSYRNHRDSVMIIILTPLLLTLLMLTYQLGEPSLTFLEYVVDSRGISIQTQRVEAIKRFTVPTTPKELERFWGICAFIHRFVRHASGKMPPLTQLENIFRQHCRLRLVSFGMQRHLRAGSDKC